MNTAILIATTIIKSVQTKRNSNSKLYEYKQYENLKSSFINMKMHIEEIGVYVKDFENYGFKRKIYEEFNPTPILKYIFPQ